MVTHLATRVLCMGKYQNQDHFSIQCNDQRDDDIAIFILLDVPHEQDLRTKVPAGLE